MADTLQFDLVSPERKLASVAATSVQIPGMGGDFTAMPNHAPFLTTLRPGVVRGDGRRRDHRVRRHRRLRRGLADRRHHPRRAAPSLAPRPTPRSSPTSSPPPSATSPRLPRSAAWPPASASATSWRSAPSSASSVRSRGRGEMPSRRTLVAGAAVLAGAAAVGGFRWQRGRAAYARNIAD